MAEGRSLLAVLAGTAALCSISSPSFAQDVLLALEPTSRWTIDYGEESCALRRTFASGSISADLEILQQAPGPYFRVAVMSTTLGLSATNARVRFEPDGRAQVPSYLETVRSGGRSSVAFTDSLQTNAMGQPYPFVGWSDDGRDRREASITALTIEDGFDRDVRLAVGEMHAPMTALRLCMRDLFGSWGVDLDAHETLTSPLRGRNLDLITRRIRRLLPPEFFRSESDMPAVVRTVIGPNGRVARCVVHLAEWEQSLSEKICDLVTREARFDPARDKGRKPIFSYQSILLER